MTTARHAHTLRAPWYVLERGTLAWDAPQALRPALQKYDTADFVNRLIEDPRASLLFDQKADVWTFPVPASPSAGRRRFATHRLVRTGMRKLYQPNHERFYAVVAELFCDSPGLPLPGPAPEVEVRFVVRRERVVIAEGAAATQALRKLGQQLAARLDHEQHSRRPSDGEVPPHDDIDDVAWIEQTVGRTFTPDQQALVAVVQPRNVEEAWVLTGGRGRWVPVAAPSGAVPELAEGELEHEMWAAPVPGDACARAESRSLWFAPVPTLSADRDAATGAPKFDDRSTYRILCLARNLPASGHETCPPLIGWSLPSEPFRLAAFLDPEGTKNHRVTIVMPDFRALAARAGEPPGPGGVEVVQPPGSQLKFSADKNGKATPLNPLDFGQTTTRCTFALELLMIVAMFLFSLFMPVVVLIFQLWWMLLLRFCLPQPEVALKLLATHFDAGGTIAQLPTVPVPRDETKADQRTFDEIVDAGGMAAGIADPLAAFPAGVQASRDLVAAAAPLVAEPEPLPVEEVPDDPLCTTTPPRRAVP